MKCIILWAKFKCDDSTKTVCRCLMNGSKQRVYKQRKLNDLAEQSINIPIITSFSRPRWNTSIVGKNLSFESKRILVETAENIDFKHAIRNDFFFVLPSSSNTRFYSCQLSGTILNQHPLKQFKDFRLKASIKASTEKWYSINTFLNT